MRYCYESGLDELELYCYIKHKEFLVYFSNYNGGFIEMKTATVMLKTISDVKEFVNIVAKCDFDVDLISGRYAVDAKSIMGIFSLDLSKKICVEAHTDKADEFIKEIQKFIISE